MPQNITDAADTFTDPIQIPADADPADLTYIETLAQGLANRTRYLRNRFFEPTPVVRQSFIRATSCFGTKVSATSENPWIHQVFSTSPNEGYRLASFVDAARLVLPLDDFFPTGAEITAVHVIVEPGAARGGGSRMKMWWIGEVIDTVDPTGAGLDYDGPLDEVEDDGTTNRQRVSMTLDSPYGAGGYVVSKVLSGDNSVSGIVILRAGSDAGTNRDKVHGFVIDWKDPGVRNW